MKCEFCGESAALKCGGCKIVYYCDAEHQKLDWRKGHKSKCKCYEISECEIIGRYMRSTRIIKAGEIILCEKPLVYGPKIISAPICLGCNKYVKSQEIQINQISIPGNRGRNQKPKVKTERNFYKCSTCKWPMCNEECEKSKVHLAECQLMAEKKFQCSIDYNAQDENRKESAYCAILPLRCLLQKKNNDKEFAKFYELEDHLKERIKTPIYSVLKSNLITFFKTILSLDEFDEMTILKTAAILDTNAFEVRLVNGNSKIRAIYATTAMMSHDCVPNSYHSFDENMQIFIRAAIDIKKGDVISLSYCQPLQSTMQRRIYLRHSKCFDCLCQRCRDPTECSTFIGSLVCHICREAKLLPDDPLNDKSDWNCENCSFQVTATNFQFIQNRLQFAIENLPKQSPYDFETFLEKYCYRPKHMTNGTQDDLNAEILLHEQNTFVLQIKYALTQLYGNVSGFLWDEIGDTDLDRKISLCRELLEVAEILEPGKSVFRGRLLIDLQEALFVQTERLITNREISSIVAHERFNDQLKLLNEAKGIFEHDSTMLPTLKMRFENIMSKS
ncbi:SET and MYND domain-containing protein DDB_G0273589 [Contarinia nasturtii]|uniref:SET and MYND domain-containing protein DDB_G0273589 n=1 Tax=Contarinia nasturtii TaxID=265458 RepID=UPI0012D389FB|nr:SET and MYND domain-containing protein DDB_G0273589 [Contarinia nasturtii]